jgi:phosphoribosyl 1,2-cyclic phosphodiesterase
MRIKFYGTRGSVPVSNPESVVYGGNTTCVRLFSECLPEGVNVVIDAGTGFVPMVADLLREEIKDLLVLFSHYHHDHTQGLFLAPITFMKNIPMTLCGPVELGIGPERMMEDLMRPPYFPVHFREVRSHITSQGFEFPKSVVILIHPVGGYAFMDFDRYERLLKEGKHLPVGEGKYSIEECLVVTMHKSRHPEYTISYRFEEKPTGKVFVFLTDHENEDGLPLALRRHLQGVDLLIMDAQYTREKYNAYTAGFGHGTPDYCVKIAAAVKAGRLGLTHHDPGSTDRDVEGILEEARQSGADWKVDTFLCRDYQEIEV